MIKSLEGFDSFFDDDGNRHIWKNDQNYYERVVFWINKGHDLVSAQELAKIDLTVLTELYRFDQIAANGNSN